LEGGGRKGSGGDDRQTVSGDGLVAGVSGRLEAKRFSVQIHQLAIILKGLPVD